MEIVLMQGNWKTRAVMVEPTQRKSWLCEEYANVGLETESRVNHWIASTEEVMGIFVRTIMEDVIQSEGRVDQTRA